MLDWRRLRDRLWQVHRPDFARLAGVLRRTDRGRLPFFELAVDKEIVGAILERPSFTWIDKMEFYLGMGYDYVPCKPVVTWPLYKPRLGTDSAPYARANGREWLEEGTGPIRDFDDLAAYPFPGAGDVDYGDFTVLAGRLPRGAMLVGMCSGVFENAIKLMGMRHFLESVLMRPTLVEAVLARVSETLLPVYRRMAHHAAVGAVLMGDDMGFNTQTLVSPDVLRSCVLPLQRQFVGVVHDAGKPLILHSCGAIGAVMDDLIDAVGVDALHSYQDTVRPVTQALRDYGARVAILGGVDVDVLARHTPDAVRHYVRRLLDTCGRAAYALGSGNTIANYVPVENYLTMIEEGARFRGDV